MHISWARLASFCPLGVISDPLIVSKCHNETHDPKGQENKIYTIVKLCRLEWRTPQQRLNACLTAWYIIWMAVKPVFSEEWERHLQTIRNFFDTLSEAKLTVHFATKLWHFRSYGGTRSGKTCRSLSWGYLRFSHTFWQKTTDVLSGYGWILQEIL